MKTLSIHSLVFLISTVYIPSTYASDANLQEISNTTKQSSPKTETETLLALEHIRKNIINPEISLVERAQLYNPTTILEQLTEELKPPYQAPLQKGKKLLASQKDALKNEFYASRLQIAMWCFSFNYFMTRNMIIQGGKEFFEALLNATKSASPPLSQNIGKSKKTSTKSTLPKNPSPQQTSLFSNVPGTNKDQRKKILEPLYEYLSKVHEFIFLENDFPILLEESQQTFKIFLPTFFKDHYETIQTEFNLLKTQIIEITKYHPPSLPIFSHDNLYGALSSNATFFDLALKLRFYDALSLCNQYADFLEQAQKLEEAKEWYQKATEKGSAPAMSDLGWLLEKEGNFKEAKEWYQKAAEKGSAPAMKYLALLLAKEGKSKEAKEWYQKAAEKGSAQAMNNLGWLLEKEGKSKEAKEWYQKAIKNNHTHAMGNLGVLLEKEGKSKEAKELYQKMAGQGIVKAMNNLGVLLEKEGKSKEAKEWYQKAINKRHASSISNLGGLLLTEGHLEEAGSLLRQALETHPYNLLIMFNLSRLEHVKGNLNEAKEWLQKVLTNERFPPALYSLANLEWETRNLEEAEELATKALDKGEVQGFLLLAAIHEEKKNLEQAKNFYQKAIASNVEDAEAFYIAFLEKIGELEQARKVEDHYLEMLLPEEIIPEEKTVEALAPQPNIPQPNLSPSVQEQLYQPLPTPVESFKAPTPAKKYLKYLERAEKQRKEALKKPLTTQESDSQSQKTYKDVLTEIHPDIEMNTLTDFEKIMIQKCLTSLANGEHKRSRYEPLTGYDNLHSMRLTHEDRLVFRILEGSIHQGVTKIQIMSIKGHYEKDSHKAFKNLVTSEVSFIPWSWIE
ncbi:MAG: tetratricopeptide repeat protein [Candidatus Paracaedimonas acanthamoebae]|uniref:Tetratricopeptide repeat protein n=1 Tax=Candidatus Paracaedimonas acanthamoebae TaxID=244581 RepID=A0A8J7TSZ6_9PROT|nr:tetratricopeptide repeat protein [Candidatus Paracaedimonas acanthamoebae]